MDLITFELGTTTGMGSGGNGRQYMHTCTAHVHMHLCMLGGARKATGGNGFDNFRAAHYHWDKLDRQWEATRCYACLEGLRKKCEARDLVTFGLHTIAGTVPGGNGRQWI